MRQLRAPARSAGGNFRGTATSACAGAEPCAVSFARRRTRKCTGGRQLPGNSYLSLRPGTRRAAADACRRPRVVAARHSCSARARGQGMRSRMHAEGPGEWSERGQLPRNSYLGARRGRAVRRFLCTAKDPGMRRRAATSAEQLPQRAPGDEACRDAGRRPRLSRGARHLARHAGVAKACLASARRRPRGGRQSGKHVRDARKQEAQ